MGNEDLIRKDRYGKVGPNIIWQYWETREVKPPYIDGLYELAKQNSQVEVIRVTPETLLSYLPHIPHEVLQINELAHKADMIRSLLLCEYGGMWLDSDAIVIRDVRVLFDHLQTHDFVGFTDGGKVISNIRVNCFLARAGCPIMREWVQAQHLKLPRTEFKWLEIGTDLLDPICLKHKASVKVLPFRWVCPIPHTKFKRFYLKNQDVDKIIDGIFIVMMHNNMLKVKRSPLFKMSAETIASEKYLLSEIMRYAMRQQSLSSGY